MSKASVTKNKANLRSAAKTSSNRVHVVPTKSGWAVKKEGALKSSGLYSTKRGALIGARTIKNKSSIVIHKKDGTIERWVEMN